ncbi:MAG: class I tRNA ligase family protein, partial [Victivallaceae bacterium]
FNTAISQLMIFVNEFSKCERMPRIAAETFVKLLSVFAPHLGEELWQNLGHNESIAYEKWPEFDPAALIEHEAEILVQVCGKPKTKIMMPADADNALMEKLALADEAVQNALGGRPVRKVICVKGRLVNIVG